MTSMVVSSCVQSLERRGERDQHDVARLLDRLGQAPLMRGAHARDPPRRDLAALADEGAQQANVLVVDIVDFIDAEPAHLLAPEILLLAAECLVAARGPLRRADGSTASSLFSHCGSPDYSLVSAAGSALGASGAGRLGAGC